MVICLERDADLHMAQLMPVPLTVSCFSKIQICFTFLVPAHPGSPGKRTIKWVCVLLVHALILMRSKNQGIWLGLGIVDTLYDAVVYVGSVADRVMSVDIACDSYCTSE